MKKILLLGSGVLLSCSLLAQTSSIKPVQQNAQRVNVAQQSATVGNDIENTLLWELTGNGLAKPSYIFGTMHILCASDARLSDSLKGIIRSTDLIYFEIDMDNMLEMLGALKYLKMNGNKKLSDFLTAEEYQRVKNYFENKNSLMPFSLMETFKPFFISSLISEQTMECREKEGMEQAIIRESRQYNKEIKGLESVAFQASVFDSIPYEQQAKELVKSIDSVDRNSRLARELVAVYKMQDLKKIEELTNKEEGGIAAFMDLLLYNRNADWAEKMSNIMKTEGVLFAVGAAHLPGDRGVLNLLRKKGYTVRPMGNSTALIQ